MNNFTYEINYPLDIINHNNSNEDILNQLYDFFGSIKNTEPSKEINKILPILSGNSKLSIRVIDWFVTNYAKKKKIIYPLLEKNGYVTKYIDVYLDYKSLLKGYKKKLFDPFCRNARIPFYYTDESCLITTIAQLNFFKWALKNNIIDYIEEHFDEINNDMIMTIKNKTNSANSVNANNISDTNEMADSTTSSDKKRHELSENANKTINCHRMKVIIDMS